MTTKRSLWVPLGLVLLLGVAARFALRDGPLPKTAGPTGLVEEGPGSARGPGEDPVLDPGSTPDPEEAGPANERVASADPDPIDARRPSIPIEFTFPPGTPPDESVDLVLLAGGAAAVGPGSRGRQSEAWEEVARIEEVTPRAGLALPVPEGFDSVRIQVDAHYLYLAKPIELPVRDEYETVAVRPELGGRVRFQLLTPTPSTQDPEVLAGSKAYLEDRPTGFGLMGKRFPKTVHVGEDLAVDCRGQRPDHVISVYGFIAPFAPYRSKAVQPSPGLTLDVDVKVLEGLEVHGRVVGPDGEKVEGAFLWVTVKSGGGTSGSRRELDAAGEFHLRGVHPDLSHIVAKGGGYLPSDMNRADMPPGPVIEGIELRMREGSAITGRVLLPDGRPASGVAVSLHPPGKEDWPKAQTKTDGEGRFRFGNLGEVSMVLGAGANFELPLPVGVDVVSAIGAGSLGWRATGEASTGDHVELTLEAPVPLRGRAFDDGGEPVPVVTLKARRDQGFVRNSSALFFVNQETRVATTDGEFTWTALTPGRWIVGASAPGYSEIDPIRVEVPSEAPIEFRFVGKRTMRGRVVDGEGRGIAGAKVHAHELHGGRDLRGGQTATSEEDGTFEVSVLPMIYRLHSTLEGWAASESLDLDVRGLGEDDGPTLVLRRGGRVECELVDALGDPVPMRSVDLILWDGSRSPGPGTVTDGAGLAAFGNLLPGAYVLRAELAEGGGTSRRVEESVEVRAGTTVRVVLGGARVTPVEVTGRLTSGGEPLPGFKVSFDPVAPGVSKVEVKTDADGSYRAALEGGGPTRVGYGSSSSPTRLRWEELPVEGEHRLDLELPGAGIRGKLISSVGALPFSPQVRLTPLFGTYGFTSVAALRLGVSGGNRFAGSQLPPGRYLLTATPDPFFAGTASALPSGGASREVELIAGETLEGIELVLGEPGVLEVEVIDEDGKPFLGATVAAFGARGNPLTFRPIACSGSSASITILPPGDVVLEARSKTHVSGVRESLRLESGVVSRATLIVQAGGSLRVVLPEGVSLSGAGRLTASIRLGCEYAQVVEQAWPSPQDREAVLGPLAPGNWSLRYDSAEGESSNQDFVIAAGEELRLELAVPE